MLTSNVQLGYILTRGGGGGGQAVQGVLSCPTRPEFQREWVIRKFYYTWSTSGIFSWKRYKLYFSQSEMLSSNVQLNYVLTRGGEQAF